MWLGYRESCLGRDAVLWFHGAYTSRMAAGGKVSVRVLDPVATAYMATFYPPRVLELVQSGGLIATLVLTPIAAPMLITLGVPACKE